MSQIYKPLTSGGPIPTNIPTSFQEQTGSAVPAANILIIDGFDSTENNNNGIATKGGVAAGDPPGTGVSNEVSIYLTNRLQGVGTTVGALNADLVTFSLGATPGAFNFELQVVGFNASTPAATAFTILGCMRTTGAAATLVSIPNETFVEDIVMISCDVDMVASGNNLIIRVTGVAGLIIDWNVVATYVFVS